MTNGNEPAGLVPPWSVPPGLVVPSPRLPQRATQGDENAPADPPDPLQDSAPSPELEPSAPHGSVPAVDDSAWPGIAAPAGWFLHVQPPPAPALAPAPAPAPASASAPAPAVPPVTAAPQVSPIIAIPGLGSPRATVAWQLGGVPSPHRDPDGSWSSPLTPASAQAPTADKAPDPIPPTANHAPSVTRVTRVIGPTNATAGRAGGPGFQPVRAGAPSGRPVADMSVWQKAQHVWHEAGIVWDQPPGTDIPPELSPALDRQQSSPPPQAAPSRSRHKQAPGRHARSVPLPPDLEPTAWPGRMPLPLGAPVFTAPIADSDEPNQEAWPNQDAHTDQDAWTGQDAYADQNAWTQPDSWTDQDTWGETTDRWDDEQPPIRPRPAFLSPSSARGLPPNDTLLLDAPARPGSIRPRSARPGSARSGSARPGLISRRTATIGVPAIVLVAVAVLALGLLTGHGPKSGPLAANQAQTQNKNTGTPRLPLTAVTLATYPGQQQRGVFQTINRVVASGNTIVTMGAQTSGSVVRQQFFVSTNGGTSWHVAPVANPDGSQPPLGYPAALLAGGPGGWAAVGPQAIWTSSDGLSWTLAATHGISPQLPGDSVWVMTKTPDGFLAAGAGASGRGGSQAVIWLSRNGVTWQRMTAGQLNLAGPGETVQSISYATWHGNDTVIAGTVVSRGKTYSAAWLSANGGTAWTRVTIPAGHGATTTISGLGFDDSGLIAIRPGRSSSGAADGISYFSPNGLNWQYAGTLDTAAGWTPGVVKGSDYGFVVTGTSASGQLIAFTSAGTGTTWQPTGTLGRASTESVVGATVAPASAIIAVGYNFGNQVSQQPVFLAANAAGGVQPVSLAGIAGAVIPELTVDAVAVADGQQIAVGSADGYPAIWRKAADGSWTLVSSLALAQSTSPGLRTLTSVTHGPAGWLAVGVPAPVILTSANGINWGVAGGNITQDLSGVAAVAAASGPAGYVIVGKLVAPGGACVADVWWSPNLTTWTRAHDVNDTTGSSQVLAVAAGSRGFVSVGSHDARPAVWITSDGRSWQTITLPLPAGGASAVLQQVAINGNRVVAVGQVAASTAAGASTVPFAEFSADGGKTWQQAPFSSPGANTAFTALTADSAGFTAAGTFGATGADVAVWTSATGASWAPSQASDLHDAGAWQISALAPSGSAVTGIGSIDTQQGQETVTLTLPAR